MKISEEPKSENFKPFSVTLTFESIEEVQALWMYMNMNTADIWRANNTSNFKFTDIDQFSRINVTLLLWKYLDKKLKSL